MWAATQGLRLTWHEDPPGHTDCGLRICLGWPSRREGLGRVTWQRMAIFSSMSGTTLAEPRGDGCPLVLPSSPCPIGSWELSQACLVSSEELGSSGLCWAGLSGTLTPGMGPAHHRPGGNFIKAPDTRSLSCPPRGWYSACFSGLCYHGRGHLLRGPEQDELPSPTYHLQIE